MTKIDIVSGFLGAGKTTLIKKLLAEAYPGERLVLIENEFGEISVDGGFLKEAGVQISEMSSGCICCSLVGDFSQALKDVYAQFHPDRILIEPSGVGKLSDVIAAVQTTVADLPELTLNSYVTVVDACKIKSYLKNFGEFYLDQIGTARTMILSRTQKLTPEQLEQAVATLKEHNPHAVLLTTPWEQLDGKTILSAIEHTALEEEVLASVQAEHTHGHHHHHEGKGCGCGHHHHHEDEGCGCGHGHHHHHEDEGCGCGHGHHHHHEDEDCGCGHGHHHHHEGEDCGCGHGHHHHHEGEDCGCGHGHHHHHHADEVFSSWGRESAKTFTTQQVEEILCALDGGSYGTILRAKGIVPTAEGVWIHFDYVPQEHSIRTGPADYTGRVCVIGSNLNEDGLARLFQL